MSQATETLERARTAGKLVRLTFREEGPRSHRRGQGALLRTLLDHDGATQRDLVDVMGVSRRELKDVVRKAERSGLVVIGACGQPRTYTVGLTDEGRAVAERRLRAHDRVAQDVLSCLSAEEAAQLDAISGKLIASAEEKGIGDGQAGRRGGCPRRGRRHKV